MGKKKKLNRFCKKEATNSSQRAGGRASHQEKDLRAATESDVKQVEGPRRVTKGGTKGEERIHSLKRNRQTLGPRKTTIPSEMKGGGLFKRKGMGLQKHERTDTCAVSKESGGT